MITKWIDRTLLKTHGIGTIDQHCLRNCCKCQSVLEFALCKYVLSFLYLFIADMFVS